MKRRGFTLIEILIVIGIIMVLLALLTAGFRHINRTAAIRETDAELRVCRAMLTEYENHAGLKLIEEFRLPQPPSPFPPQQLDPNAPKGTPQMFPVYLDPFPAIAPSNAGNNGWPTLQFSDLAGDMSDRSAGPRYQASAVMRTIDVIYALTHSPANQIEVKNLPAKRILEAPAAGWPSPPTSNPVAILDGWGNPIIFVPRAGMHVYIVDASGNKVDYIVRSTETFPASAIATHPLTGSERPFFASAGQDGDFTLGNDNVYSFQQ